MNIENVQIDTVLIPIDPLCPLERRVRSGIKCIAVDEKGFRFRRLNEYYNGEEFFLTRQALETSKWEYAP
jgi:hypothetical protein